jgi:superfamily II DNA or RNA helicase
MSLISFKWPLMMDTSSADLIKDFFEPALATSSRYDRGVGYFSSGWLRVAAAGMLQFAANGGRARWITSPILNKADWEAMCIGIDARSDLVLRQALGRNIADLAEALEKDTLSVLAWMVANEIITFKLALPQGKLEQGDFHDKFGIFTDSEDNQVSFNGSYNDSIQGQRNYESIKIFCSWHTAFAPIVQADAERFERLWKKKDPNVRVFDLAEAAQEQIIQLRTDNRPYSQPRWSKSQSIASLKKADLWRHQSESISIFLEKQRGILEMATGTGKTRTALQICNKLIDEHAIQTIIVAADGNDLLDQWYAQLLQLNKQLARSFIILRAYQNHHERDRFLLDKQNTILLSSRQNLPRALSSLLHNEAGRTLLIHDEVHRLGSPGNREALEGLSENIRYRLGLSATPEREYDKEGNAFIEKHIGPVLMQFGLDDAIRRGILAPFTYYPIEYTPDANDRMRLQQVHKKAAAREAAGWPMSDEEIWIELAKVYKTSKAKLPLFNRFIQDHQELLKRCIIFVETKEYGDEVLDIIHRYRYDFHTYYAEEDSSTLRRFAKGDIECLITCHRLSEGIDIRSIETVILFSSARARLETIQRIGRCLRINPSTPRKRANVVDFIRISDAYGNTDKNNPDKERCDWLTQLSTLECEEEAR